MFCKKITRLQDIVLAREGKASLIRSWFTYFLMSEVLKHVVSDIVNVLYYSTRITHSDTILRN